jgi:hypothetical protein
MFQNGGNWVEVSFCFFINYFHDGVVMLTIVIYYVYIDSFYLFHSHKIVYLAHTQYSTVIDCFFTIVVLNYVAKDVSQFTSMEFALFLKIKQLKH